MNQYFRKNAYGELISLHNEEKAKMFHTEIPSDLVMKVREKLEENEIFHYSLLVKITEPKSRKFYFRSIYLRDVIKCLTEFHHEEQDDALNNLFFSEREYFTHKQVLRDQGCLFEEEYIVPPSITYKQLSSPNYKRIKPGKPSKKDVIFFNKEGKEMIKQYARYVEKFKHDKKLIDDFTTRIIHERIIKMIENKIKNLNKKLPSKEEAEFRIQMRKMLTYCFERFLRNHEETKEFSEELKNGLTKKKLVNRIYGEAKKKDLFRFSYKI